MHSELAVKVSILFPKLLLMMVYQGRIWVLSFFVMVQWFEYITSTFNKQYICKWAQELGSQVCHEALVSRTHSTLATKCISVGALKRLIMMVYQGRIWVLSLFVTAHWHDYITSTFNEKFTREWSEGLSSQECHRAPVRCSDRLHQSGALTIVAYIQ